MALIKCNECEKQVSDKAEFCPHCGIAINAVDKDINKNKMSGTALAGGIVGICTLFVYVIVFRVLSVLGCIAIILSSIGLGVTIEKKLRGRGWALLGLILGIIDVVYKLIIFTK